MNPRVPPPERPRVEDQPVHDDAFSAQIEDTTSRIEGKETEIRKKKSELNQYREEEEMRARSQIV